MTKPTLFPPDILRSFLSYDPETGEFRWAESPHPAFPCGSVAGTRQKGGYIGISFKNRVYKAHRLAWWLHTGSHPAGLMDHINGDPGDNRIANLREATATQNLQNRRGGGRLKKGVYVQRCNGAFAARITVNGQRVNLGTFVTEDEAHAAYCVAAVKYHGEFARFA